VGVTVPDEDGVDAVLSYDPHAVVLRVDTSEKAIALCRRMLAAGVVGARRTTPGSVSSP
jgi:hypothetical protein